MFNKLSFQELQLRQINSQITGIKMNLDLSEQNVSHGIAGINALRSQKDLLLENFRILQEEAKIVSIESIYQFKDNLKATEGRIKKALAIYNNIRSKRDNFKKHYDKVLEYRKRFIKENLTDAKILIFKRKKDVQKSNSRGNST